MRQYYPAFNWTYTKKRRIELDPEAESFIIAPQRMEVVSIKGTNTVCYLLHCTVLYIYIDSCSFFQISKEEVDDRDNCDDIDSYPPRVFLEGRGNFTSCSVNIKNLNDCVFQLSPPSGVHMMAQG